MRVLHIYHDFQPVRGGIEDHLADLTRAQAAHGLETIVLCANGGPRPRSEWWHGVHVLRAASLARYFTPFCPSWPLWIVRLKPDLVHLHLPCPLGEWSLALAHVPRLIVSLHNDYVRPPLALRLHRPVHRAMLKRADAIIASSDDYARTSPVLRDLQGKVRVVPYGIRVEQYTPSVVRRRSSVLFAGRLCYYKGVEVLLDAARHIRAHISIIGDGPWRRRLRLQAERNRLNDRVCFRGALGESDLIETMRASGVFAFPSTERSEAFGIAQLKAMACGLPVVSSDLPGVRWLNRHGETGLTVRTRDACALAHAINQLLDDDRLRARMSAAARERAQQFTLERMTCETQCVYEMVMSG